MNLRESLGEKLSARLNETLDNAFFSENRDELMDSCRKASVSLLDQEGYFTPVMVFVEMGVLSKRMLRLWHEGRLPAIRPLIRLSDSMIERCISVMKDVADQFSLEVRYMPFYDPKVPAGAEQRPILPFTLSHDQAMERALSLSVARPVIRNRKKR